MVKAKKTDYIFLKVKKHERLLYRDNADKKLATLKELGSTKKNEEPEFAKKNEGPRIKIADNWRLFFPFSAIIVTILCFLGFRNIAIIIVVAFVTILISSIHIIKK